MENAGYEPSAGGARPDWIAVDWGTSALRVWAMADDGTVLDRGRSDQGMGGLDPEGFEPALLALIGGWLPAAGTIPVIACGMVGARQGWAEAGYRPVPCAPLALPLTVPPVSDSRIRVGIVPGLSQLRPSADVMRGEETQIAGVMALEPGWDGVVCLPGTHSKWAEISAGEVVSFRSFMTGELFALLSTRSVLRHGLAGSGDDDEAAFDAAVLDGAARPEALAARLFTLRAEALLTGLPAAAARARLSGLLIGAELVAARPWWLGRDVLIVGDDAMAGRYGRALSAMGVTSRTLPAERAVLAGLSRARALAARESA
ncbi:2-dehydro-3-deoxygalactonokinase [uncultured Paracoccus sp.]|uniref:2-dehydro-3-deoxygalactonokinase n=1 Tax=uncultured Paracoccus sp. TaxID=189685 RepID=UPI00261F8A48|nr:2-dehydro-3-deoxygalactonokinase [uncultured Paracoccus sp.]